jgi:two-component system cell cycle sensor histidine kinase/response regulator CckA
MGSVVNFVSKYAERLKDDVGSPVSVLVVDDEEAVRKFVERVLREAGYRTAAAADGPEAITVAAQMENLDILVTDVMMPQMQGDELARRLRQRQPALKVLYLTGYSERLFKDKITLWEDEAFLDKPCSIKGLKQAVALLQFGRVDVPGESNAGTPASS